MLFSFILLKFLLASFGCPQTDTELNQLENEVFIQVNNYRKSKGKPALLRNASMDAEARKHSQNMASGRVKFGHGGFETRVTNIRKAGLPPGATAENVAFGYKTAETVTKGWIKSPGHHKNMTGNYLYTGIGVAKSPKGQYYFTQLFLK